MRSLASRWILRRGLIRSQMNGQSQQLAAASTARQGHSEAMKDEYGNMDAAGETFIAPTFRLESG